MSASGTCPKCGASLADAAQGLCLRCLVELGVSLNRAPERSSSADSEVLPPERGRLFGDYELLEEIARGGMGIVYKARQKSLNRIVALKMLPAGLFAQAESVQRFRVEAEAIAQLQHPNIVTIHEIGEEAGQPYFTMDYVAGRTLAEIVREGPLAANRAAGYVRAIAEAVHFAHEHGIIHRDLKPSNVIISGHDEPHITDFGLAKRFTATAERAMSSAELTVSGQVLGSPNYLPPEQAEPKRGQVGPWSDVYALGGMLYHLLTGRPPFQAESLTAVLRQVIETEPVAPRLLNPSIPRDLETICLKCVEKEPGKRYSTARLLAQELDRFLRAEPICARAVGRTERAWRWCCRNRRLASALGAAALSFGIGLIGVSWQWRRAELQRVLAERRAYISEINAAQAALAANNPAHALDLLNRHRPRQFQRDPRGFEWRYLWQECQDDAVAVVGALSTRIRSLDVSRDGSWLAAGAEHGELKVWSLKTGREIKVLTDQNWPSWVTFSPDSSELVFTDQNVSNWGTIRAWNMETGQRRTVITNFCAVGVPRFSSDGRWLLYGEACFAEASRKAVVVDYPGLGKVRELKTLTFNTDDEHGLDYRFTTDGRSVIFTENDPDRRIGLWNFTVDRPCDYSHRPDEAVIALAVSPDGRVLATGAGWTDTKVRLWEIPSFRSLGVLSGHEYSIMDLAFSPDGGTLASASADQTVRLWEVATKRQKWSSRLLQQEVWRVCFAPDGQTVFSGCNDGSVQRWSVAAPKRNRAFSRQASEITELAVAPKGNGLAAIRKGEIWFGDAQTGALDRSIPQMGSASCCLQFSGDGRSLFVGSRDGDVWMWSATEHRLEHRCRPSPWPIAKLLHNGPNQLLVIVQPEPQITRGRPCRVSVWDATSWRERKSWITSGPLQWHALSPNGRWLGFADVWGPVQVWDIRAGTERCIASFHAGKTTGLAFSPNGQLLAAANEEGAIRIWSTPSFAELTRFRADRRRIECVSFSADSRRLLTTGQGRQVIKVWDVDTWQELLTLSAEPEGTGGSIQQILLGEDGRLFARDSNGDLLLWSVPSLEEIDQRQAQHASRR